MTVLRTILRDAPLAYWPIDEPSGTTLNDRSGNGWNATCAGGPTMGLAGPAGHLAFGLAGSQRAYTVANTALNPNSVTVEAWAYRGNTTALKVLFDHSPGGNPAPLYMDTYLNRFRAFIGDSSGNSYMQFHDPATVPQDVWQHVCMAMDSSVPRLSLWINNVLRGSTTSTSGARYQTSGNFFIGRYNDTWGGDDWIGRICQMAIFGSVLTDAQRTNHYEEALRRGVVTG